MVDLMEVLKASLNARGGKARREGAQGAQEGVRREKPRLPRNRPSDEVRCRSTPSPTSRDFSVSRRRSSAAEPGRVHHVAGPAGKKGGKTSTLFRI